MLQTLKEHAGESACLYDVFTDMLCTAANHLQKPYVQQPDPVPPGHEQVDVCGLPEGAHPRDAGRAAPWKHPPQVRLCRQSSCSTVSVHLPSAELSVSEVTTQYAGDAVLPPLLVIIPGSRKNFSISLFLTEDGSVCRIKFFGSSLRCEHSCFLAELKANTP